MVFRFSTISAIARKELRGHLDNPASYIAFVVFVVLWEFLFFRSAFLVGEASLRLLYDYLPWTLLLFAAAVTMGAFAQEKSEGTLELLLTHPVREVEAVLGKFFSSFLFVSGALLFAVPIALGFSTASNFDWGAFIGQLSSSALLAGCLVSLGMFLSSLLGSHIASLLASAAVSFFFLIVGTEFITANVPLAAVGALERLSVLSHADSMARGVIDVRDVWYFISFIASFLALTYLSLLARKYGNRKDYYRNFQLGTALFIGIAILTNIVGARIPGRLDLTSGRLYSLSRGTIAALRSLTDVVTVTFYVSSRLPSQFSPAAREVKDILRDYAQVSNGNITVVTKDPSSHQQSAQEAISRGVKEVQFNVIGQEEFQVKTGFFGLVVSFADVHEVIPFLESTSDLEYQLTSFIVKLTTKDKKTIAFLSGHGEKSLFGDYQTLNTELAKQFTTQTVTIDTQKSKIASEAAVLVVAGPTESIDETTRSAIKDFLAQGKSAMLLVDSYTINLQFLQAQANANSFVDFSSELGVNVANDVVYDLRSNETVRMGQGVVAFLLPYPFWVRTQVAKGSSVSAADGVVLPWASTLALDEAKLTNLGYDAAVILATSPYAGVQTGAIQLSPDKAQFDKESIKEYPLAVALTPKPQSGIAASGRVLVVGDSDFLSDGFAQNAPQNIAFGLSALSWLGASEALADIRIKQVAPKKLLFLSPVQPFVIKYGNLLLAVVMPSLVGLARLVRRRSLRNLIYQGRSEDEA